MNVASQVFVAIAGVLHVAIFAMESLLIRRPQVYRRFMIRSESDLEIVHPWAFNQGFYNLFLALGALGGLVFDSEPIALFSCGCMAAAGLVLVATDRRMIRAAAMQAVPPLLALLFAALA